MNRNREIFFICLSCLIGSMLILYFNPRFDILSLLLFTLLFTCLYIALTYVEKKRQQKIDEDIDEIIYLIQAVDSKSESLELKDEGFSKLKDEVLKSLIEKRQLADKALGSKNILQEYMEDITHQIKTPLTGILLMLDLIEDDPDNVEEYTVIIRKDIQRLYSLTDLLLKMSSLDADIINMEKKEFSAYDMIQNAVDSLASYFSGDELKIQVIGSDFTLVGDRKWSLEALINLLKNALEASVDHRVEVELKETSLYKSVLVRDFGTGISYQDLNKVFQRFYKSDPKSKGFGIGLPMAKTIMKKQGGDLLYFRERDSSYFEMRFYLD